MRSPAGRAGGALWLPKLWAQAWAPFVAIAGAVGAIAGLALDERRAAFAGLAGALAASRYTARATAAHRAFDEAFGPAWEAGIPPAIRSRLQPRRWAFVAAAPPPARRERDVVVGALHDGRPLLADLWWPPAAVVASGLAAIYLHGSLWQALDKDFLSAPLLRRLAGQGHAVIDLAYPLAPAASLAEMLDAVGAAIAWAREHGPELGANPDRIVLIGAAGGAHLALLAAFGGAGADAAAPVCGVVATSGIADPIAFFDAYGRTNPGQPRASLPIDAASRPRIRDATPFDRFLTRIRVFPPYRYGNMPGGARLLVDLFGGTPGEVPEAYATASPLALVSNQCPPVLQLAGGDDFVVDATQGRRLHAALRSAGVPSILVVLPSAVHGFDQYFGVSRRIAPAAQAATYDIERFLGVLASR